MSKVSKINESIEKWSVAIESRNLEEAVEESSIEFRDTEQGVEVLAFAAAIRALGLSNRDLQPRKSVSYTHLTLPTKA